MKTSFNSVVWVGIVVALGTFGGCKGYTSLGDPPAAGAGGEGEVGTGGEGEVGTGGSSGDSTGSGGSSAATGVGGSGSSKGGGSSRGGVGGTGAGATGGDGMEPTGGLGGEGAGATGGAGMEPTGGTGTTTTGGVGGTNAGDTGGATTTGGIGGAGPVDPYAPRSGSFKMLGYSRTTQFRHQDAISAGKVLLTQIAAEQGFEVTFTETNEDITLEGLSQYEIVFFLNTTGTIFNSTEKQAFEDWMTTKNGAFAGVHSATDTEIGWGFYSEVTGQYHDGHTACCPSDQIIIAASASDFPAFRGLPNPWIRSEEWMLFNSSAEWSQKPGFRILATHGVDSQPVTWVREFGNFRSFYSAIGHAGTAYQEPLVKKHLTGGILWAVRREHLIR